MKHFYKVLSGMQNAASMVSVMNHQHRFQQAAPGVFDIVLRNAQGDTKHGQEMPLLKSDARGLMIAVNGASLGQIMVVKIDGRAMAKLPPPPMFVLGLHVIEAKLIADNESVSLRTGDVWQIAGEPTDSMLANDSDDDVFAALIEIGF